MVESGKASDPLFRVIVGTATLLGIAAVGLFLFPEAGPVLAAIPLFIPMTHGFFVLETFTIAFLTLGRHRALRDPASYWIGIAFASFSISNAFYVLTWPGLRADGQSLIGHLLGTASWMIMPGQIIFTILLIVAVSAKWPDAQALGGHGRRWSVAGWLALFTAMYVLLIAFEEKLPALIGPQVTFMPLMLALHGTAVILCAAGVVLFARYYRRFGDLLAGYVALDLICVFYGLIGSIMAGERYAVPWYAARLLFAVGGIVVLFGLLWEYIGLYRRERDRTCELEQSIAQCRKAEEAVRRNEAELREAQRLTHVGSWFWNAKTDATTGSDELLRIFGLDPTTQSMPRFREQRGRLYPVESWERVNAAVQETLKTGIRYELDVEAIRSGTPIWITTRGEVVPDAGGRIEGLRGTLQDITERRRAEQFLAENAAKLEAINRELESFSYSIPHDLRAPLRAIAGFSRMILKKEGPGFDEETRRRFQAIMDNVTLMNRIIDDLLAFSRLGRQEVTRVDLDMEALVREAWQELVTIHPDREMSVTIGPMPAAAGDRTLIRQVYGNLLGNAVKFTRERNPAVIEAGCLARDEGTVFYVRDNGIGFDMKFHDKLFGVFERLHSKEEYEGTGIGLAIVQRIVERHGGRVWAEARVNEGATFYFSLSSTRPHA